MQVDCRDGAATHGVGASIVGGELINADQHAPALLSLTPRFSPHKGGLGWGGLTSSADDHAETQSAM